jgi:hypothetical protein
MDKEVVGFMSGDGHLGRTFLCETKDEREAALTEIFEEQGGNNTLSPEYWDDNCTYVDLPSGDIYFVGGLETA